MELALLAAGSLGAYLLNQDYKQAIFKSQNSMPLSYIADQYRPFNDPQYANIVGCAGSYPAYVDPRLKGNPAVKTPYGYNSDPNYINYINDAYYHRTPYNNLYMGPPYVNQPIFNPMDPKYAYDAYARVQERKFNNFRTMVDEQGRAVEDSIEHFVNDVNPNNFNNIGGEAVEIQTTASDNYDFIPSNDPTSDYLETMAERPISDFTHNNMVPFFGAKATQNMAGTGVQSGNYTDGVNVNSGFDYTSPLNSTLASYSGVDDTYLHKREAGPLYSPAEQQTGWVFGQPVLREDLSRFTDSLAYRNDLAPTEPIMVGPGLDLDPSIPAAGGFHEFTRVLDNNVNDYKANQLEGRVNYGKMYSAGLPTAYPGPGLEGLNSPGVGVPKNKPDSFWSQSRLPTMSNWAAGLPDAQFLQSDWNVDKRPNNAQREQTSYGLGSLKEIQPVKRREDFGNSSDMTPAGFCLDVDSGVVGTGPIRGQFVNTVRDPTYMSLDNNIRSVSDCNSLPLIGPSKPGQGSTLTNNYYVNETDRGTVDPTNIEQLNVVGPRQWNNLSFNDSIKTTMKETTEFSYANNPSNEKQGSTFYTADDLPRTTQKETLEYAYAGDPSNEKQGSTFYSYEDGLRTTNKETTEFSYASNPAAEKNGSKFWTAVDTAKPTIKQSTNFSYAGILGSVDNKQDTSRFQYTGSETRSRENFEDIDVNSLFKPKIRTGGADTFAIRGTTLVKDYFPGAGRMNILQDPEYAQGKYDPGTFALDDLIQNGPGSLLNSLPDASRFQNNYIFAIPHANPNKLVSVDDRSTASYQVEQLKNNPLSIFTDNPDGRIPNLYADNAPSDYSPLVPDDSPLPSNIPSSRGMTGAVQVYPKGGDVRNNENDTNANASVVYNSLGSDGLYNPLIEQGSSRKVNQDPKFSGRAYSGKFENNKDNVTIGGRNGPEVYGSTNKRVPREYNDRGVETSGGNTVCKPNDALKFADTLLIDRDLK